MKLAIVGGRDFSDYNLMKKEFEELIGITEIISGGAKGADSLAEKLAKEYNLKLTVFKAEWNNLDVDRCIVKVNKYGQEYNALAGHNRNEDIINNSDFVLAFWDGKSKGTANSIGLCSKYKKPIRVVRY